LKVELEMTVATTPDGWIIGLVADKLSENSEVILNVIDI
jgi:hypothetical protein